MPAPRPRPPPSAEALDALNSIVARMAALAAQGSILGEHYAAARELGAEAFRTWGPPGMLYAFGAMSLAYGNGLIVKSWTPAPFHPQDFYAAWDGVGSWRA